MKIGVISRAPVGSYTSKLVKGFDLAFPNDWIRVYASKKEMRNDPYIRLIQTWTQGLFPFQIFRQVCRDKPSVVHIQHEFGAFGKPSTMAIVPVLYLFLKLLRIRTVSTIHTTIFPHSLSTGSISELLPIASWIPRIIVVIGLHIIYAPACRLSDLVIVHQNSHKESLCRYYRIERDRIVFVPHGVGHTERAATQESLIRWGSVIGRKKVALYFGYLSPRKGLDSLLDAFEVFSRKNPDWILILAGGLSKDFYRPYLEHIKHRIKSSDLIDKVMMTGFVSESDADAIYRLCDLVILPYTQSVGNASACNLAMGYGKPVIATNISPFTEEIENGKEGILCTPNDFNLLVNAMEKLSSDPQLYRSISQNLESASQKRDWKAIAQVIHQLYESIHKESIQQRVPA